MAILIGLKSNSGSDEIWDDGWWGVTEISFMEQFRRKPSKIREEAFPWSASQIEYFIKKYQSGKMERITGKDKLWALKQRDSKMRNLYGNKSSFAKRPKNYVVYYIKGL